MLLIKSVCSSESSKNFRSLHLSMDLGANIINGVGTTLEVLQKWLLRNNFRIWEIFPISYHFELCREKAGLINNLGLPSVINFQGSFCCMWSSQFKKSQSIYRENTCYTLCMSEEEESVRDIPMRRHIMKINYKKVWDRLTICTST